MGRTLKNTLIMVSFFVSVILLIAAALPAFADDNVKEPNSGSPIYAVPDGPLSVPVFPRGTNSENSENGLPKGADLRDSYIMLEDGSVLSVADWIVGALNKDKSGIAMTDYENRLFLGQVARAAVGMDENLINRSLVHAQPTLTYKMAPPPKGMEAAALSLASLVVNTILPGTPEGYDPATYLDTSVKARGDSTLLFDRWFNQTMNHTVAEFQEAGTMQVMLKEQRKKLKKNIAKKMKPKSDRSVFTYVNDGQGNRQ